MELETIRERLLKDKEERYNETLEYWRNRKPFKDEDDIPSIPKVKEDDYKNVIVPNIIRCGGIPKDKLEVGKTYIGDCRNATRAVWNGQTFTYIRRKFGYEYPEDINHFEDDDGYDLFVPIRTEE